jgi:hypothetical protein
MLWLDRETFVADFASYDERLRALVAQEKITDEEYRPYGQLLPWNRIQLHYTTRRLFEASVEASFVIVRAEVAGDYTGSEHHPIYTLRRR